MSLNPVPLVFISTSSHYVVNLQCVWVLLLKFIYLTLYQHILRCVVRKKETNTTAVLITNHRIQQTPTRSDTSPASDEPDLFPNWFPILSFKITVAHILQLLQRSLHIEHVSNIHSLQILGHLATLREINRWSVHFDDKVDSAALIDVGNRRVLPWYGLPVYGCDECNTAPKLYARCFTLGQRKFVDERVMIKLGFLNKLKWQRAFSLVSKDTGALLYSECCLHIPL